MKTRKSILSHALAALLAVGLAVPLRALADRVVGGTLLSSTARIKAGSFKVVNATTIDFIIDGTADLSGGGSADGFLIPVTCRTTGANLAAAWAAAVPGCVTTWRTANGL